jgi:hypothetical protein
MIYRISNRISIDDLSTIAMRLKKAKLVGTIGASIIIGLFNFEISIGVEVELAFLESQLIGDDEDPSLKPGSGMLIFQLQDAKNLSTASEYYCTFGNSDNRAQSKVSTKTANPVWNEIIRVPSSILVTSIPPCTAYKS